MIDRRSFIKLSSTAAAAASLDACADAPAADPPPQRAFCRLCTSNCGLELTLQDDRLVRVSGDQRSFTRGYCCPSCAALPQVLRDPARVRQPLKRVEGRLEPCTWDEALGTIADRLRALKAKHGARSLAMQTGYVFVRHPIVEQMLAFCRAFGTPNFASVESICEAAIRLGETLTYGRRTYADFLAADVLVLWGCNPFRTHAVYWDLVVQRMRKGMKLVVIDPYRIRAAASAHSFLQLRPGSDLYLALWLCKLALARVVGDEALGDDALPAWIDERFVGFRRFRRALSSLTRERVAEACDLDPRHIDYAASLLLPTSAGQQRVCMQMGLGIEMQPLGLQAIRAVAIFNALSGNLGRRGGNRMFGPPSRHTAPRVAAPAEPPLGFAEHPLAYMLTEKAQSMLLPRAVLEGKPYPVRALLAFGTNFLKTHPDGASYRRAVEALDLFVSIDPYLTETSRQAHFVLPVALFPEREDLISSRGRLAHQPQLATPAGQSRSDWQILLELGRRLALEPFAKLQTAAQLIDSTITEIGLDPQRLRAATKGLPYPRKPGPRRPGLGTPSGKIEIFSEALQNHGATPMPVIPEGDALPPEKRQRYPLQLVAGAKRLSIINSSFEHLPVHTITQTEPWAELHPRTLRRLGLKRGAHVLVESPHGSFRALCQSSTKVKPGVVYVPSFFIAGAINRSSSWRDRDPISGFPNFRALRCRVTPA